MKLVMWLKNYRVRESLFIRWFLSVGFIISAGTVGSDLFAGALYVLGATGLLTLLLDGINRRRDSVEDSKEN